MKRGVLLFVCIMFLASPVLGTVNQTSEGGGFLLMNYPQYVMVDEEFEIGGEYFFMNQLVFNTSIIIEREGRTYLEKEFMNGDEAVFSVNMKEDQAAMFTYMLVIEENTEMESFHTEIPLEIRVASETKDEHELYYGIDIESEELMYDDLRKYEPPELAGKLEYSIRQKNINAVDCQVQEDTVIFLVADGFAGESKCTIQGKYENTTIMYMYSILVGTSEEISDWEHIDSASKEEPEEKVSHKSTLNTLENDLVRIWFNTIPEAPAQGDEGKMIVSAESVDESLRVDMISIVSEEINYNQECMNMTNCTLEQDIIFDKPGRTGFNIIVNFVKSAEVDDPSTGSGWTFTSDEQDIIFRQDQAEFIVQATVEDISIPSQGIDAEPDTIRAIFQEYQRKKRIPLNMDYEIAKMQEFNENVIVEKVLWPVTVVNDRGQREEHTGYKITITPKQPELVDYLLGIKRFRNVSVFEHISKESAVNLGHIRFDNSDYEIVKDDPLVVWHFDDVESDVEINYEVDKPTEDMGNTVVTGDVTRGFPNILFAVILIPIVVLTLIYFDRFKKSPKAEIGELMDKPPDYKELEEDDYAPDLKVPEEEQPPQTIENIGDFDKMIDSVENYIAKRVKRGDHREHIKQELTKANWPADIVEKLIEKHEKE